jgi:hypothetical protein
VNSLDLEKVSQLMKPVTVLQMKSQVLLVLKMHIGSIFCGLAKAFDCVNHE